MFFPCSRSSLPPLAVYSELENPPTKNNLAGSMSRSSVSFLGLIDFQSSSNTYPAGSSHRFSLDSNPSSPSTHLGGFSTRASISEGNQSCTRTDPAVFLDDDDRGSSDGSVDSTDSQRMGLVKKDSKSIEDLPFFRHGRFMETDLTIGRGAIGVVFLAHDNVLNRTVAVKKMARTQIDAAIQEWESGSIMFSNPHFPKIYGLYQDAKFLYLVQDWVDGKDLGALMNSEEHGVPEDVALYILKEVVKAVIDLHAKGVLHRDIKPGNILLENEGRVWLIDLGSSSSDLLRRKSFVGTPSFMAPEISNECYDEKADIWSLGILLFYMLTGKLPFAKHMFEFLGRSRNGRRDFVLTQEMQSLLKSRASVEACDLIYKMFEIDPIRRLDLNAVLEHPWMAQEGRAWMMLKESTALLESLRTL